MDGLIIDDNRSLADALKQMLDLLDVPVRVAYGSSPAMAVLGSYTPRFVFLDLNMPGVSGFDILSYIKRDPRLMKVPVFITTSDDQKETRDRVMRGGAEGVIIKPVTMIKVEDALKVTGIIK